MKFSLVIFFLLFASIVFSKTINTVELVKREGLYYDKSNNILFTGELITKYAPGKVSTIENYKKGMLHGPYEVYDLNGKLLEIGTYIKGKLDGPYKTYWDNDNPMHPRDSISNREPTIPVKKDSYWHEALSKNKGRQITIENYKNGILNGIFEEYYPNGQLMTKVLYKDGKEDGLFESYWNNGQVKVKEIYINGRIKDGIYEWFWKNSQLHIKRSYKNGELEEYESYYKHGQLKNRGKYSNKFKNGVFESYWFNGQLRGKETFNYGIRVDGTFISYWYNGKVLERGSYRNGTLEGSYEVFYKNGKLEFRRFFDNGVEISCEGSCS